MLNKTAADILREKINKTHLTTTVQESTFPKLEELGGIDYLKDDIKSKIYNPLFHVEKYAKIGLKAPKSILIYGIEGVGKSFIVECFAKQYRIPVISRFIENASDIREIFRKSSNADKSIILIDNLDTFDENQSIFSQLKESIEKLTSTTLVIFINKDRNIQIPHDSEIFIKIPTLLQRKEIFENLLSKMKTENLDTYSIAYYTPGFVPRNIVKLISMATTRAVNRILDSKTQLPVNLIMEDFEKSIKDWKNIDQLVTFDDIGALENVKEELKNSIFLPSKFPEKFLKFGIGRPSGILLYGPPGCGKTLIAKAVANMSHCNFLSIKGPELITKYVGDSEKHLRELFEKARNLSPCVLFFDEIDSLCSKRGKNEFGNRIVNQILTLLDGMEDRGEVYLIGATNRINSIDKALLRPGRFDKIIEVPLPSKEERIDVFNKSIRNLPVDEFDKNVLNLEDFSSADISGVVKEAAVLCLRDNFESENVLITEEYFLKAVEKFRNMKNTKKK